MIHSQADSPISNSLSWLFFRLPRYPTIKVKKHLELASAILGKKFNSIRPIFDRSRKVGRVQLDFGISPSIKQQPHRTKLTLASR
jgi:hypothetical protein